MLPRTTSHIAAIVLLSLTGCVGTHHAENQNGAVPLGSGDSSPQTASNVVDMSSLVPRERAMLERLLGTTYAPCTDQAVPLDICIEEKRPCYACVPATRFLADRVKAGLASSDVQRAYAMRFGADVRQVEIADSPTKGPANAPVTLMVWSDFECPACKRILPIIDRLVEAHDKDVRLVHKLYPLPKHPHSEIAARAAYAAKLQGKYWDMEHALFDKQSSLSDETIKSIAEDLNLDMRKFQADASSPTAKTIIDRDMADADRSGLTGTPFLLINGREFDLGLFRPDADLEPWITMEIDLAAHRK